MDWFEEKLHPGFHSRLRIDRILHETKTNHQHLIIFDTDEFGRVLALDGVVQTTERDEFIYHEMLAHTPIFAHGGARHVLIIGGGDGGMLEEVLKHVSDGKQIFIEIKCPKEVLPHLKQVVHDSGLLAQQTVFIAFDWETIRQTKLIFPSSMCYWLSGFKQDKTSGAWEPSAAEVLERALEAKVDGVDVSHTGPVSAQFVAAAHEKGLEVHVYTVNEVADARRIMKAGVDGITTDRPLYLRERLGL